MIGVENQSYRLPPMSTSHSTVKSSNSPHGTHPERSKTRKEYEEEIALLEKLCKQINQLEYLAELGECDEKLVEQQKRLKRTQKKLEQMREQKWIRTQKLEIDKSRKLNKQPGLLSSDRSLASDKGGRLLNKQPGSSSDKGGRLLNKQPSSSSGVDLKSNWKPQLTDMGKVCQPNTKDGDSYLAFDKNSPEFEKQLTKLGLCLHDIPGDGNCLFRALGDQLEGHQENHFKHRCDVVDYMVEHRYAFEPFLEDGISFNRYTAGLRNKGTHAGNDAIVAFAKIYDLNVIIHQLDQPTLTISGAKTANTARKLHIAYHNGEHYSSVRRVETKTTVPTKYQVGKPRGKMDTKEQHRGIQGKTVTSSPNGTNHVDDVPRLKVVEETHHKLEKAGEHTQTSGSIPREENSWTQSTKGCTEG